MGVVYLSLLCRRAAVENLMRSLRFVVVYEPSEPAPSAGWTVVLRRIEPVRPLFESLGPPLDVVPATIYYLTAQFQSGQSGPIAETVDQQFCLREVVIFGEKLVYGHGSGYGDDGPYTKYPAMDLTIQAISGVMHTTGFPNQPPVEAGPAVSDFIGGIHLATGIFGALFQRSNTGEGQYVEVGMFDCVYPTLTSPLSRWVKELDLPSRTGNQHTGMAIAPYNVYEVKDGYLAIICIAERHWDRLTKIMGVPELANIDRFSSKSKRANHLEEVDGIVRDWVEDRTVDETIEVLLEHGIPTAPIQTIEEVVKDPHLEHRGMLNEVPNKGEGRDEIPVPGSPIKYPASESRDVTPSPRVGEHTDEVLSEFMGYSDEQIEELREYDAV